MAMDLQYYNGDCTTPEAQAEIRQNFILILNGSVFNEICNDPVYKDMCKPENVRVTCSMVDGTAARKRRSTGV